MQLIFMDSIKSIDLYNVLLNLLSSSNKTF